MGCVGVGVLCVGCVAGGVCGDPRVGDGVSATERRWLTAGRLGWPRIGYPLPVYCLLSAGLFLLSSKKKKKKKKNRNSETTQAQQIK